MIVNVRFFASLYMYKKRKGKVRRNLNMLGKKRLELPPKLTKNQIELYSFL